MIITIIGLLLKLFTALFVIILIGYYALSITNKLGKKIFNDIFLTITIGSIICVFFCSVIQTQLKTVNILMLFPVFFILKKIIFKINLKSFDFKYFIKIFSYSLVLIIPFFLVELFYFIDLNDLSIRSIHYDYTFYSEVSKTIFETGIENKCLNINFFFPEDFNRVITYHYFELWLNAFLVNIIKTSYLENLMLITYPILKLGVLTGIISFIKSKIKLSYVLFSYIILSIGPLYFEFYNEYEITNYYSGITQTTIFNGWGRKYLSLFLIFISVLKFSFNEKNKLWVYILMFAPIMSVGTLPGVLGGIIVILITNYILFKKERFSIMHNGKYLFHTIIFCICYFLFYKVFGFEDFNDQLQQKTLLYKLINNGISSEILKQLLFTFLFPFIRLFIFLTPIFFIFIFIKKEVYKVFNTKHFLLILLTVISGLIFSTFTNGILNSGQFFYNVIPFLNLFIIINIIFILDSKKSFSQNIFLLLIILISVFNTYQNNTFINRFNSLSNNNYSNNSKDEIKKFIGSSKKIAFLKDTVINPIDEIIDEPLNFLCLKKNPPIVTSINTIESYDSTSLEKDYSFINPFIHHRKLYPENNSAEAQYNFIKKYNYYILLTRNTKIPEIFKSNIIDSIININQGFDENIYKLKF